MIDTRLSLSDIYKHYSAKTKTMETWENTYENSQKTHYVIAPKRRKTRSSQTPRTPFINLLNGQESEDAVSQRYKLYQQVWSHQNAKIESIMNSANQELFEDLADFIHSDKQKDHIVPSYIKSQSRQSQSFRFQKATRSAKLPVGFLQLGSNTANNLRVLSEFDRFLQNRTSHEYKIVTLNSKTSTNIKMALRDVVRQFFQLDKDRKGNEVIVVEDNEEEEEDNEEEDEEAEEEVPDELDLTEEQNREVSAQGRVSYDLDIVYDWCMQKDMTKLNIVFIIEDTNSMNNQVLSQLVRLLHAYSLDLPIKVIMGLSSDNMSDWINSNFNVESRILIDGYKFQSSDNKNLGHLILKDLFLAPNMSIEDPLLVDPILSAVILNRFENSNNSIDSLISEIKLSYMIHFFHSPLSLLLEQFPEDIWYVESLRKTASLKRYIEKKMSTLTCKEDKIEVRGLLFDEEAVKTLFKTTREEFRNYKLAVVNVINVVYKLQGLVDLSGNPTYTGPKKEHFQLYKLIVGRKLVNSIYLSEILQSVKKSSSESLLEVLEDLPNHTVITSGDIEDKHLKTLLQSIQKLKYVPALEALRAKVSSVLREYLQSTTLGRAVDEFVFYEVFTLNGSAVKSSKELPIFEEKYENLMLNLVRPNLRATLEGGLENSNLYLKNKEEGKYLMNPTLNQLFRVYKEAPVSINIYDFYIAFKQSLDKAQIIKLAEESSETVDIEKEWDSLTYSWFIQSCFELMSIGLLKEKPKGDYLEKALWKGV